MNKTNRRTFIKTAAGALAAMGTPLFAGPDRSMIGAEIVKSARGNLASKLPLIDACSLMPDDQAGIDAFLSASATYGVHANLFVPNLQSWTPETVEEVNSKIAKFVKNNGKAKFAGAISLANEKAAIGEFHKSVNEYKVSAITISLDGKYAPIYSLLSEAAKANIPVILSSVFGANTFSEITDCSLADLMSHLLMMEGISHNLKIIVPHFGGAFTWALAKRGDAASKSHPFYFYAGGEITPDAFKCFKGVFGSDRFLFGSCGNMEYREAIKNLQNLSLSSDDFKKACFENANKLFGFSVRE